MHVSTGKLDQRGTGMMGDVYLSEPKRALSRRNMEIEPGRGVLENHEDNQKKKCTMRGRAKEYNQKQYLTVEIIRIMILLRLIRERDQASLVTEALDRRSWPLS
ncbi:hypothetical protein TNCV_864411 [Trichonephila clavipes]|nr:hypothetical protein TNCV_864411 [Trichonephila clavipes]